jgi:hypothetical protein
VVAILYYKNERRKGENQHVERMKVLELGLSLPDVELARCKAESGRTATAGAVGILVPFFMAGSAIGATALVLFHVHDWPLQVALLCTVWGVCGLVSLLAVVFSLVVLRCGHLSRMMKSSEGETSTSSMTAREPIIEEPSKM